MVNCCVPFCSSATHRKIDGKKLSYHEFPSDLSLRERWLKAIRRKDFVINDKSRSSVVCGKHFKEEDFIQAKNSLRLKKGSVPSIFPGYPKFMQPSGTHKRILPKKREPSDISNELNENNLSYDTKNDFPLNGLKNKASDVFCSVLTPLPVAEWILPNKPAKYEEIEAGVDSSYAVTCRDIYLGGTRNPSTWREDIAIPLLKKKGLTYFLPQDGIRMEGLIPMEATNIENSQVLLFVIKNDSSSLEDMILASHYIGLGCQVVLCIQYISDDVEINNEKLSIQAVKDYNRGRVYLSDLATRAGVPVFSEIDEAVNCAISFCSKIS